MEYNKTSKIVAVKPSSEKRLGGYYLDLTSSIIDYQENRYGDFDENSIPMIGTKVNAYYNVVVILQYGLILYDLILQDIDIATNTSILKNILTWLDQNKCIEGDSFVWKNVKDNPRYGLKAGYISAMTQGEAISFYLRMYELFQEDKYLSYAQKAYNFLSKSYEEGGTKRIDNKGYLWYEEYPSSTPSFVLNGFVYTVFGIYDLYKKTQDPSVKKDFDECIRTLSANVHRYDVGYWSVYDLLHKELVMAYYQKNVHVPQMEALFFLTNNPVFLKYKTKWEKTLNPINILFVEIMYRVRYRWFWLSKKLNKTV